MSIRFTKVSEPLTPPLGKTWVYVDTLDNKIKAKKDDGSVFVFGDGTGTGGGTTNILIENLFYTLTPSHILAKKISLPHEPIGLESVRLTPVGGPEQIPGIDFAVSGFDISWSGLGLDGILEGGDGLLISYGYESALAVISELEIITLSPTHITNKSLSLSFLPINLNSIILTPSGGPTQVAGIDYDISGSLLTWSGLGLDGVLSVGDTLIISYQRV